MTAHEDAEGDARTIRLEVEVAGTPEQVWAAIATGPGLSAWLQPTELEEREGGAFTYDLGNGPRPGTVTAWEPPRHLGQETQWEPLTPGDSATLATEWIVEGRDDGTCVVRMVMSGFGTGDAWDNELDGLSQGMRAALQKLREYLGRGGSGAAVSAEPRRVNAGLPVADVDKAVAWYEQLLGRPVDARPMDGLAEWRLSGATVQLVLDGDRAGGGLLCLTVDDLSAHLAGLAQRGLRPGEQDDATSDKVRFATIDDPDGNRITLVEERATSGGEASTPNGARA